MQHLGASLRFNSRGKSLPDKVTLLHRLAIRDGGERERSAREARPGEPLGQHNARGKVNSPN
jgi:hypothetical protein